MKNSVFDYLDYKKYLLDWEEARPKHGHGVRRAFAHAIGCQTAYVSQVLNSGNNLSLEQTDRLNRFLGHTTEEAHFFFLLVQYARSGTDSLKGYFSGQLQRIQAERLHLKNRLKNKTAMSPIDLAKYFSGWYYAAIHVLISIKGYQTKHQVARALELPLDVVANVLDFLVKSELAEQKNDQFTTGPEHIHLGHDSSLILRHHTNWRLRALDALALAQPYDLHYSSVVSIAQNDAVELKKLFLQAIENANKRVEAAKEETMFSICLDFFQVIKANDSKG